MSSLSLSVAVPGYVSRCSLLSFINGVTMSAVQVVPKCICLDSDCQSASISEPYSGIVKIHLFLTVSGLSVIVHLLLTFGLLFAISLYHFPS